MADDRLARAWQCHQANNYATAEHLCRQIVQTERENGEAWRLLGEACLFQGKYAEAVEGFRQALRLGSGSAEVHSNLGAALAQVGRLDEAVTHYRQALQLRPGYVEAHNNLGVALTNQGRLEEAAAQLHEALRQRPDYAEALVNLGNVLCTVGRAAEAEATYRRALALLPTYADGHTNLGNLLYHQGRRQDALAHFEEAVRLQPQHVDAHAGRALSLLARGDWPAGLAEYEWRWKSKKFSMAPVFARLLWDGSPLAGRTILLHAEQGLGDTIQFIRYAALVKQRGGRVIVACQKALLRLLAGCPGIDELVPQDRPVPAVDVQAPLLSLPRIFGTTPETIPADVHYLSADPALVEHWRRQLSPWQGFKVGVVWQGSRQHVADRKRSVPLRQFAPLARLPGVHLFSLQKGDGVEQLHSLPELFPITDLGARMDDAVGPFLDMAAIMKNLDLVIGCDTAVIHLAGALGVPVWVALPLAADWRWLQDREDTPWYPTMRLFRQLKPDDWDGVFRRLTTALAERLAASPGATADTPSALLDRTAVLQVRGERLTPQEGRELAWLTELRQRTVPPSAEVERLAAELKAAHERLSAAEEDRARLKRRLDELLGAPGS
jgi:Flp pilus assembly protein TadD